MNKNIIVTGASSGFGLMAAQSLARAGHTVFAGMRSTTGRNAAQMEAVKAFAADNEVDLRAIEMDVVSQSSVDAAIDSVIRTHGRIDVIVHNAGHMTFGPSEAFTPEQLAELYDVNVLSTQRVNRAALPHMRKRGDGLLLWISSSSTRGGTPPCLGPYFAAYSPAGSWNAATPRTKVAVTRPSPETFWWRSAAIREKTEETLYQFMAETNWTMMRVVTAFRFSIFLNKRTLRLLTPAYSDYNDWSIA